MRTLFPRQQVAMAFPLRVLLFLFLILIILDQSLPVDATEVRRSTVIFSTTTTNNVWSTINKSPSAIALSSIKQKRTRPTSTCSTGLRRPYVALFVRFWGRFN